MLFRQRGVQHTFRSNDTLQGPLSDNKHVIIRARFSHKCSIGWRSGDRPHSVLTTRPMDSHGSQSKWPAKHDRLLITREPHLFRPKNNMLPINDEIPPGSGVTVLVEGGPAVIKHQRYLGIRGRGQLHLKVQRLSQVPHHWIVRLLVERVIRGVWNTEQDNRGSCSVGTI